MRTFTYGEQSFAYEVKEGAGNRFKIEVHPDLRVFVFAPPGKEPADVEARLRRRAPWVFRALSELAQYHPPPVPKKFRSGESFVYLGRQYQLKIIRASQPLARLVAGQLQVQIQNPGDHTGVGKLVEEWLMDKATSYLPKRISRHIQIVGLPKGHPIPLRIRRMKTRWGSCSPKGAITLNPELMKASSLCIDYVILHELCHLKILNHGSEFYRLLSHVCPDWRARKHRLNKFFASTG